MVVRVAPDASVLRRRGPRRDRLFLLIADSVWRDVLSAAFAADERIELVDASDDETRAFAAAATATCDVVLLDADEGSPREAAHRVGALAAAHESLRIVCMITPNDLDLARDLCTAGASSCIAKNIPAGDLGAVVRCAARGAVYRPTPPGQAIPDAPSDLSTRELEILRMVADGLPNKEIAKSLWVTEQTVKFHLTNGYRKLGASGRDEAVAIARRRGLFDLVA